MSLTNHDVKRASEVLFAHTLTLQTPEYFVGREPELDAIEYQVRASPESSALVISEPLGSGKTVVLRMALARLLARHAVDASTRILSVRQLPEVSQDSLKGPVVIIDEIDRKIARDRALRNLASFCVRLGSARPRFILSGDQTLHDEADIRKAMPILTDWRRVPLKPLDRQFLVRALEKRALLYEDVKAQAASVGRMFDSAFLDRLVPETAPPVQAFRDALSFLMALAKSDKAIPLDSRPCRFSGDTCRAYFSSDGFGGWLAPEQRLFLGGLREEIRSLERKRVAMKAFTTRQARQRHPVRGVTSDVDFEARILDPLARAGALRGFGIPYKEGTGAPRRDPGPYLPTAITFLRAAYDEAWP